MPTTGEETDLEYPISEDALEQLQMIDDQCNRIDMDVVDQTYPPSPPPPIYMETQTGYNLYPSAAFQTHYVAADAQIINQ